MRKQGGEDLRTGRQVRDRQLKVRSVRRGVKKQKHRLKSMMTRYAVTAIITIYSLITFCPQATDSSLITSDSLILEDSIGQSPVCAFDRNSTRNDFVCWTKTCFNRTSGLVTEYRSSCHRVKNRLIPFDERSRHLIRVSQIPMNELRMIIKGAWKDWVGLQFIEYLASRATLGYS